MTNLTEYLGCSAKINLPYKHVTMNHFIGGLCYTILAVSTISINSLVLLAFYKLQRFKYVSDCLLMLLATLDLLSGIFTILPTACYYLLFSFNKFSCELHLYLHTVGYVFSFASIACITTLTWEMYLSVTRPFKPKRKFQNYLMYLTILVLLLIIITVVAEYGLPYWLWKPYNIGMLLTLTGVYIGLCIMYYSLYKEVKGTHQGQNSVPAIMQTDQLVTKTSRLTCAVLIVLGVTYTPYIVTTLVLAIHPTDFAYRYVMQWCYFLSFCNDFIDPLIYCIRLKAIRHQLKDMLCGWLRKDKKDILSPLT